MENNENKTNASTTDENSNQLSAIQDSWSQLPLDHRLEVFNALNRTDAEELYLNLSAADQLELMKDRSQLEIRSWLRLLAPDDAADLIQELPLDQREEFLNLLDPQTRDRIGHAAQEWAAANLSWDRHLARILAALILTSSNPSGTCVHERSVSRMDSPANTYQELGSSP